MAYGDTHRRSTETARVVVAAIVFALLLACGDPGQGDEAAAATSRITLAQGGGFTGLYKGYHIHADGRVERWQQLPGGIESVMWTGHARQAEVRAAAAQLRPAAGGWRSDGSGNTTGSVTFVQGDSTFRWSWPGFEAPPDAPAEFRDWLRRTRALCERAAESARVP